jgi:hypothetical protein
MEGIIEKIMVRMMGECENELSPKNMYACPQLNTFHVGSYFVPLVPNFRTQDKIIIHTLGFKKY